jgi:hypothetical protein
MPATSAIAVVPAGLFDCRRQGAEGPLLILPHEADIAVDIGTQNRGELAFHTRA